MANLNQYHNNAETQEASNNSSTLAPIDEILAESSWKDAGKAKKTADMLITHIKKQDTDIQDTEIV